MSSHLKDGVLELTVRPEREPDVCPCCGAPGPRSKGLYRRVVRHLEALGRSTRLVVQTRRLYCTGCHKSFIPDLPGIRPYRHSSEPFRRKVAEEHHHGICARQVARLKHLGDATVGRIYQEHTGRQARERESRSCPQVLGIDAHTLHGGQRWVTTFCDLKNRRLFDLAEGTTEAELTGFLSQLQGRDQVRVVCIDLSTPFRRLIRRWFPNARVVADRFHVIRIIQQHVLKLARQAVPMIASHRGYLACLRKRPDRLKPHQRQRRDRLLAQHPVLKPLYQRLCQLHALMNQKHRTQRQCRSLARQLLNHIHALKTTGIAQLQSLANTLEAWQEPIACMWRMTRNNGITEGFNRKLKLIQRRAYGFRNFNNYRLRAIAQCG